MADLTSYTGLCEAVADYLGRDDMTERIPTFIALAERRMNRELRLRVMERRSETSVLAGQSAVPLPWRGRRRKRVNSGRGSRRTSPCAR